MFQSRTQTTKESLPEAENSEELAQEEENPSMDVDTNDVQADLNADEDENTEITEVEPTDPPRR